MQYKVTLKELSSAGYVWNLVENEAYELVRKDYKIDEVGIGSPSDVTFYINVFDDTAEQLINLQSIRFDEMIMEQLSLRLEDLDKVNAEVAQR